MSLEAINAVNFIPQRRLKQANSASTNDKIKVKIKEIWQKAIEIVKAIVTFPVRYLGSKKWSIPGIIFRTPIILFQSIIYKKSINKEAFFGSGCHYAARQALSKDKAESFLRYSVIAVAPFQYNEKWLEALYDPTDPKRSTLKYLHPADYTWDLSKVPGSVTAEKNAFIDMKSSLKMMLVKSDNDEIIVTFGPMDSFRRDTEDGKELTKVWQKQLSTVVSNYLGMTPFAFKQAEALFNSVKEHPVLQGKKIIFTGNCLGGAIAQYVSMRQEEHKETILFNPLQLGGGLQQKIPEKNKRSADDYITSVSVKGEFISDPILITPIDMVVSSLGFKTPANFGKRFRIPSAFNDKRSHDMPQKSLFQYVGMDRKAKPEDLVKHVASKT